MDAAKPVLHNMQGKACCAKAGQKCLAAGNPGGEDQDMKHPSSREFFAYWDAKRGDARRLIAARSNPARCAAAWRHFVLSYDNDTATVSRRRTRVCALLGRDLKDASFPRCLRRTAAADRGHHQLRR
jgi:hypothetical protein